MLCFAVLDVAVVLEVVGLQYCIAIVVVHTKAALSPPCSSVTHQHNYDVVGNNNRVFSANLANVCEHMG